MPDKLLRMHRTGQGRTVRDRPVMLAIAGDSASGKTTITAGLVRALGPERCTAVCVDDYHRYDRQGLLGAARLPDDPHPAGKPREHGLEPLDDQLMVIDEDDAHGPGFHA